MMGSYGGQGLGEGPNFSEGFKIEFKSSIEFFQAEGAVSCNVFFEVCVFPI